MVVVARKLLCVIIVGLITQPQLQSLAAGGCLRTCFRDCTQFGCSFWPLFCRRRSNLMKNHSWIISRCCHCLRALVSLLIIHFTKIFVSVTQLGSLMYFLGGSSWDVPVTVVLLVLHGCTVMIFVWCLGKHYFRESRKHDKSKYLSDGALKELSVSFLPHRENVDSWIYVFWTAEIA